MSSHRTSLCGNFHLNGFARLHLGQDEGGVCFRRMLLHSREQNVNWRDELENEPAFRISHHGLTADPDTLQLFQNQEFHGQMISEALPHHRLTAVYPAAFDPAPRPDNHCWTFYEVAALRQAKTLIVGHHHDSIRVVPRQGEP